MAKKEQSQIMVDIIVRAYNQEDMVRQALDSLMAQQTTYPFRVIIGENHSKDNTLAVCREYAAKYDNIKLLAHPQNIGGQRNLLECIKAGNGKYIMICDGDDWWHNPNKIQLQVDYMEAHPECYVLHTDFDEYDNKTGKTRHNVWRLNGIDVLQGRIQAELFHGNVRVAWPTCCFRRDAFEKYMPLEKFIENGVVGEDYPTWVILSAYGEVNYMPESTITYRVGNESVTRSVNYDRIIARREGDKNTLRMLYSMFPQFGVYHEDKFFDDFYSHQLLMAAYRANDYQSARKFAKSDKMPNWKTRMACTWVTFQLARWIEG